MKKIKFILILLFVFEINCWDLQKLQIQSYEHEYVLVVPKEMPAQGYNVIMCWHGAFSNDIMMMAMTELHTYADDFLVIYPDSNTTDNTWNAGYCCGEGSQNKIDESLIAKEILKDIEKKGYKINRKNVFSTGFSNGAMLSYKFACTSDMFAGIASVAGNLAHAKGQHCGTDKCTSPISPMSLWKERWKKDVKCFSMENCPEDAIPFLEKDFECNPKRKIHILALNSLDDGIVSHDGLVGNKENPLLTGILLPTLYTVNIFKKLFGCSQDNRVTYNQRTDTDVTFCYGTVDCKTNITSCVTDFGGHFWHPNSYKPFFQGENSTYNEMNREKGRETQVVMQGEDPYWSKPAKSIHASKVISEFFRRIVRENQEKEKKSDL